MYLNKTGSSLVELTCGLPKQVKINVIGTFKVV